MIGTVAIAQPGMDHRLDVHCNCWIDRDVAWSIRLNRQSFMLYFGMNRMLCAWISCFVHWHLS